MKSSIQEKKDILEGKGRQGGHYCEAIDNDWSNTMPADGYEFYEREDGTVEVSYQHCFACYDGWDSMDHEAGTYGSMKEAVEEIWYQERVLQPAIKKLVEFKEKAIKHVRNSAQLRREIALYDFFKQELRYL